MRQIYEAYRGSEKVSALLRQLPWTHHLIILSQAKPVETREFYMLAAIKERWSSRELERQIRAGAALLTETISFAPHREALEHGSDLRILRGKRWAALPRRLQERWGVLCSHGEHSHDHFDLISLMRKVI